MQSAFREYLDDVHTGAFPTAEHSFEMTEEEWQSLLKEI
jgi:ketopantoate hydroxymethyltransferase